MFSNQFGATARAEVAIIGGGVIGLSLARALAQRGTRDIVVIEKGEFGREASWAAGGILAPQLEADRADDFFRLACASRDLYPRFARELKYETGIDIELNTAGTLYVAFEESEETELRQRVEWQQSQRLNVQFLTGEEVRALEPSLSNEVRCALRFPDDYQVENRKLVEALLSTNRKLEVRLVDNCTVQEIQIANRSVTGVVCEAGVLQTSKVIIAAGAWSSLIQAKDVRLPQLGVEPVRGQMLCFDAPDLVRHVIYSAKGYVVPRRDGRLLAGSTSERVGFDKRVTDLGVEAIKSMAYEILPSLGRLSIVKSWAGFRPRAKDDLPVLGKVYGIEGLSYATGHYRNGILLAPITAELMSREILGESPVEMLKPFSPDRFATDGPS